MKIRFFLVAVFLSTTTFLLSQQNDNLVFIPAQPAAGNKIHFEYSAKGTVLGNEKNFDAIAYISDGLIRAQEVKLAADGDKWAGDIITNDSAKAIFIVFKKDDLIDNNKEQGYQLLIFKNGAPVKGAYAAVADFNSSIGSYLLQLKPDPQKSLELYNKEFDINPDLKSKYLLSYAGLLVKMDKNSAKEKIKPFLDELIAKKDKTEADYQTIMYTYQRLGDKEVADSLKKEIVKEFPKGNLAKSEKFNAFYNESDLKKKEALLNALIKNYPPENLNEKKTFASLYSSMASAAASKKDWALFKKYVARVSDKETLAGIYNNVAWTLSGEALDKKATNLAMAKDLSGKSLAYLKASIAHPADKPPYYTDKEYKKNLDYSYGMFSDTYALILWKLGEKTEAYKYQEAAVKSMNMSDAEANERYIIYKEKVKGLAAG